jgi:hypothetical protein
MWLAKNVIPKSSCICLLLTYEDALVATRRHLQLLDMAGSSEPPDEARVVSHRTDELLLKQNIVSDG